MSRIALLYVLCPLASAWAASLTPSTAADYKYLVPPPAYWPLVNGVGMGDTVSYRAIRYADVAWLGNACMECDKIANDVFRNPRFYFVFTQSTNTLGLRIVNPATVFSRPSYNSDSVNWAGASSVPGYLDGNKSLSAVSLPANYGGGASEAWPLIAGVSSNDAWQVTSLFTLISGNSGKRPILVSTITNTYASLRKYQSLKWVSSYTAPTMGSGGYRLDQDGSEYVEDYAWDNNSQSWVESATTQPASVSPPQGGAGQFAFVAYAYSEKHYKYGLDEDNEPVTSPVCKRSVRADFYPVYTSTNSIPRCIVINSAIADVYNSGYNRIGSDIPWRSRIDGYERISCFRMTKKINERCAATAIYDYVITNATSTTYVLVNTSGGIYIEEPATSYSGNAYNKIYMGYPGLGLGSAKGFLDAVAGSDGANFLSGECDNPRQANFDEDGDPDWSDTPYREVSIKVEHVWSISVVKPKYTCTFE